MPVAVDTAHKKVVVAAVDTVASSSSSFVVAVAVVKLSLIHISEPTRPY